jgi:hypothetical protein
MNKNYELLSLKLVFPLSFARLEFKVCKVTTFFELAVYQYRLYCTVAKSHALGFVMTINIES